MTGESNREQEEKDNAIDAFETRVIEADLVRKFGIVGVVYPDEKPYGEDHEVVGWVLYGRVYLEKADLPVDCADLTSDVDRCAGEHRNALLSVIRQAYEVGFAVGSRLGRAA